MSNFKMKYALGGKTTYQNKNTYFGYSNFFFFFKKPMYFLSLKKFELGNLNENKVSTLDMIDNQMRKLNRIRV